MKRLNLILLIPLLCISIWASGQWNKMTFESATANATTFTESGIPFTIANSNSTFNIKNVSNGGWNGTANDNKFIGNTANPMAEGKFVLNFEPNIKLKGFYVKLNNITATDSGFKIKLVENSISTATISYYVSKGTNTINNGYYYIDLSSVGASNTDYTNYNARSVEFELWGAYTTLQIDALEWKRGDIKWNGTFALGPIACHGGTQGTTGVSFSGGVAPYTYKWNTNPVQTGPAQNLPAGTYTVSVTDATNVSGSFQIYIDEPTPFIVNVNTKNSCFGADNGSATAIYSGGDGPYTIYWIDVNANMIVGDTPTVENLPPGNYELEITDYNYCQKIIPFTINENTAITTTVSKTDVSCFGANNGSATVTSTTGGQTPYTYSWTGSTSTTATANNLAPGTYTVTIKDAANCTTTNTITISEPTAALSATTSQVNVTCNSANTGSASVTATGGTAPYTYTWTGTTSTANTATGLVAGNYSVTIKDAKNCTITKSFTIIEPTAISATTSQTNALCNGGANGTATVTATGGTGAYTYSWNTTPVQTTATATGLSAGTYTVNVKDANNCTITKTITISQPTALTLTTSQTNVSCNGGANGTATVTATGGVGSLTYSWNTTPVQTTATATGLSAGTYTVTVKDANNCTTTKTVTVSQPAAITPTTTQTNASCGSNNGTATVSATGGTGSYTYSWNTTPVQTTATATGLAAGNYVVTVKDANNCTTTKTVTISQTSAVTATTSQTNVLCNGGANGTATVTATGGSGTYTYSWNTNPVQTTATATGLAAGTYTVTINDGQSCTTSKTVDITEPTAIVATTSTTDVTCNGSATGSATVTANGGTGTLTYSWNTTPVQTTATATNLVAGTYTVTVKDANNCTVTRTVIIGQPTMIATATSQTNVSCNGGANGTATVTATGGMGTYTYSWNTTPAQTTATATGLAAGTYTVTVKDTNNCSVTESVTITESSAIIATTTQTNTTCGANNGSATVSATGGTGAYTYSWNTTPVQTTATAIGLAAGTYTVTVKDANNCTVTKTVTLQNTNSTVAPTGSSTQNYAAGATLASLIVTGQNIVWYASASDAASHTNPLPINTVLVHNTTYYATQTVGGCQSTASLPVTVIDQALSTSEVEVKREQTSIYPNPVSTVLNIKTSGKILKVMVYAADGRKVMEQKVENNQLNVSVLPSGNYLLQVLFKEGTETFKFIKK